MLKPPDLKVSLKLGKENKTQLLHLILARAVEMQDNFLTSPKARKATYNNTHKNFKLPCTSCHHHLFYIPSRFLYFLQWTLWWMVEYLLKKVFGVTFGRTNQKGKTFIPLLKPFWREQISQWSFPKLTFIMNNKSRGEVAITRRLLFFLQTISPHLIFYCLYILMKTFIFIKTNWQIKQFAISRV